MTALDMVADRHGHPFAEDVYTVARIEIADLRTAIEEAWAIINTISRPDKLDHEVNDALNDAEVWLEKHPPQKQT